MKTEKSGIGWTTAPNKEEAEKLAQQLVEKRLVACVQIQGPIHSIYRWNDNIEADQEYRLTLKFQLSNANSIETFLCKTHSYDVPQWIWVAADGGSKIYLDWVENG